MSRGVEESKTHERALTVKGAANARGIGIHGRQDCAGREGHSRISTNIRKVLRYDAKLPV